jgi:pilus assembly protein Flp/PilA
MVSLNCHRAASICQAARPLVLRWDERPPKTRQIQAATRLHFAAYTCESRCTGGANPAPLLAAARWDDFMLRTRQQLRRLIESEDGPTAIEYAILIALIALICTAAIRSFGPNLLTAFTRAGEAVAGYVDVMIPSRPADSN